MNVNKKKERRLSMEKCSSGHEEIIYDGWGCPMCKMIEETDEEIGKFEDKISELETELEEKK